MSRRTVSTFGVILFLLVGGMALGQSTTGNLYGTVVDESGAPLPGVTVTVSGIGADRVQFTDAQGSFRILALDPGGYTVAAELDGFGGLEYPDVAIRLGKNTDLPLTLTAALEETITVTSESPLLDERQIRSGTNVSQIELEKIPTARDPWSILSQTPGVIVDRVNVGGSESGQQANFRAQGVSSSQNDFQMDGAEITDMRATGASPTYYDFDQFAEMSFTTGGTDVTKNSSGVQVNLVTKRGTNEFRGSTRFYNTAASGYFGGALKAAQPSIEGELHRSNGQTALAGARVRKIEDFGFEAGGAAIQDRLWFWGSWGQNNIGQNAASGTADDTVLENTVIKVNGQLNDSNSMVGSYNNGDKLKFGRGAGTSRPAATTWNQRGPSAQYRLEDTHVFSANFFLTGTYSHGDFGFALLSRSTRSDENGLHPDAQDPRYEDGVWQDNFLSGGSARPFDSYQVDTSYFFTTGGTVNHELNIGGRFREFLQNSDFAWGPRDVFHRTFGFGPTTVAHRGQTGLAVSEYSAIWAQDTITLGKATINVGLRWDDQTGHNEAFNRPAHPIAAYRNIFPDTDFKGSDAGFSWGTIAPRLGATYALGEERKTLIRASVSQFFDQLSSGWVTSNSPFGDVYAYFGSLSGNLLTWAGFDPTDPLKVVDRVDSGFEAPLTQEILAAVEHAFLPEFVVAFTVTSRKVDDTIAGYSLMRDGNGNVRIPNSSDFEKWGDLTATLPRIGRQVTVPYYALSNQDLTSTGGSYYENSARGRDYLGYSISFTKRLADRWMARGFYQYGKAECRVPESHYDHTSRQIGRAGCADGDLYMTRSTGSGKGERFLQSTWTYSLNGMYQVMPDRPWGFNVSANLTGREGSALPYYERARFPLTGNGNVNISPDYDSLRLNDIQTVDLRVEKEIALNGPVNMTFGIDAFNITNEGTGLAYLLRNGPTNAGNLDDNISPRIFRMGVRLSWK
jgi:hypothetical protein